MSSTKSRRFSGISPFRSRKSSPSSQPPPPPLPVKPNGRPVTPSSTTSSRPPSRLSASPASTSASPPVQVLDRPETRKIKENVTVTVRFRPLSDREINKGDEIAWYADGDYTVRNEYNPSISYVYDRLFGPATTTRHVYDVAAQHVVNGSMQGINGTVFAYGVTSSGKTHTMHGEQKSPGIIPLAVKDVFGIIQETPGREFLLRVSYLEIYNEVINDLLNPTGQNLRIREDVQGTYVDGIKEEVVLSPAHALSLIATGEEHRHVGSNNFNLLSSRSHTIFTLTIESSPRGESQGEDVTLSQLHLIDLSGSESSKTETTGLRRKEGSYINKSLLTLGTVISKLTDEKATHIPYRDSKLTRLLQSSLSGNGRISLICTLTPASSNSEETHNTLKFAQRSKHVEIKISQNKIIDEKSLIKKYQKEISFLKQELEQLKRGMLEKPYIGASTQEELVNLKLQLKAGQVKLQSRLEEEEEAKAALLGRIQRLTKLILVSTKNTIQSSIHERPGHRRTHSFAEDELAYLPDRKREYMIEDDTGSYTSEVSAEQREDTTNLDELVKDYRRNRRGGSLGWFKLKKPDAVVGSSPRSSGERFESGPPASYSKPFHKTMLNDNKTDGLTKSTSRWDNDPLLFGSFPERTQAGDLFGATAVGRLPSTGATIYDKMDLLREQMKVLVEEVALSTSSLKRLSEQAAGNSQDSQLKERVQKLKSEISEKKRQISVLEKQMTGSVELTSHSESSSEIAQALSKLTAELNEKAFELEIKSADNRILQEQLQMKTSENCAMHETILLLQKQLTASPDRSSGDLQLAAHHANFHHNKVIEGKNEKGSCEESYLKVKTPKRVISLNRVFLPEDCSERSNNTFLDSEVLMPVAEIETLKQEKLKLIEDEIETLKQEKLKLIEEKDVLEIHCKTLAEEASYAKELAAAAAVELRNLAEEVTNLAYENANLSSELDAAHKTSRGTNYLRRELQKEVNLRYKSEAELQKALDEKDERENKFRRRLDEAKVREDLENDVANTWHAVASMRKSSISHDDLSSEEAHMSNISQPALRNGFSPSNGQSKLFKAVNCKRSSGISTIEKLNGHY